MTLSPHIVTNVWQTAAMRCGECGETWEQPNYTPYDEHWVCPHCLHGSLAFRAAGRRI